MLCYWGDTGMRYVYECVTLGLFALTLTAFLSCGNGKRGGGFTSRLGAGDLPSGVNGGSSVGSVNNAGTWQSQTNSSRTLSIEQAIAEVREYTPPAELTNNAQFDTLVFEQLRNELIRQLELRRERGVSSLPYRETSEQRHNNSVPRPVLGAPEADDWHGTESRLESGHGTGSDYRYASSGGSDCYIDSLPRTPHSRLMDMT